MKLIKRELLLCVALTASVFVCALAWGSPFLAIGSRAATAQTQPAAFTGTVVRNDEQLLLRDASGRVFGFDNPQRIESFEGKTVTITGTLDAGAQTIHVKSIVSASV